MKKKIAAYAATAILVGFAIMILPLALETGQPFLQPFKTSGIETFAGNGLRSRSYGLGSQPLNLLPSSLVFFSGLIVALGVYAILKRRTI